MPDLSQIVSGQASYFHDGVAIHTVSQQLLCHFQLTFHTAFFFTDLNTFVDKSELAFQAGQYTFLFSVWIK